MLLLLTSKHKSDAKFSFCGRRAQKAVTFPPIDNTSVYITVNSEERSMVSAARGARTSPKVTEFR